MSAENPYDPPDTASGHSNTHWSFSWWTHLLSHEETVLGSRDGCYQQLLRHYKRLGVALLETQPPDSLTYVRGSMWVSCFAFGPETSCRHTVTVRLSDDEDGVRIQWAVDLKLCGLSVGKNAIIEEFRTLAANV